MTFIKKISEAEEAEVLLRKHLNEQDECEHQDVCEDEFVCLDCGKCMREERMSAAYDRAKDLRKYGP